MIKVRREFPLLVAPITDRMRNILPLAAFLTFSCLVTSAQSNWQNSGPYSGTYQPFLSGFGHQVASMHGCFTRVSQVLTTSQYLQIPDPKEVLHPRQWNVQRSEKIMVVR